MSTPIASDVVVVGGGIMGAATAFFLRRRGKSVTLIERGLVGQQASAVNFGNVRRQGRLLHQLPLANRSRAIWGRLGQLIGEDAEFVVSGHLRLCVHEERAAMIEQYCHDARRYGLELEMISGNVLRTRYPFLGPEIIAASYAPEDGHANPRLAAPAFGRAARRDGALVFENTEIVQVEKEGGSFRVTSADGRIFRTPVLVITAGAWANHLVLQFGENTPLVARGPQMAVTEPMPYALVPVLDISSAVAEEGIYMRQVRRGNIVFGGGMRGPALPTERRAYVNPASTLNQLKHVQRIVPAMARLGIIRVWSGIESYLPDDMPVLGPSARIDGLFYAFGFSGSGFQLGPGVGDVLAELITTGATSTPIDAYSIKRFSGK
jgi:sarcosine oxidase subunit beta